MKTVYKYALKTRVTAIELPERAKVRHAEFQESHGVTALWIELDPDKEKTVKREFVLLATGEPMEEGYSYKYIGTALLLKGSIVEHIYERS